MEATTEKIRVTVTSKEVKELEVTFPYFTKNEYMYCKFLSLDKALWVCDYGSNKEIQWSDGSTPERWITFDQITEDEFNAKFNEVMNYLIVRSNEKAI